MRQRLTHVDGVRKMLVAPPCYHGDGKLVSRACNRRNGIKDKKVFVPYPLKDDKETHRAGDQMLKGRLMHLSDSRLGGIECALWDPLEVAALVIAQAHIDDNLHELKWEGNNGGVVPEHPPLREVQAIVDGHGWTARTGVGRYIFRCPHTIKNHNNTRYSRCQNFFIGDDKSAALEQVTAVGGERSLRSRMYEGLQVREVDVADLSPQFQDDVNYAPLACLKFRIILDVVQPDGTVAPTRLVFGGDRAAGHAQMAITSPVTRLRASVDDGPCMRCMCPKSDWGDFDVIMASRPRAFAPQTVCNHRNIYKHLALMGFLEFADRDPPTCFICGTVVDDAEEERMAAEWEAADVEGQKNIQRVWAQTHGLGQPGRIPVIPGDPTDRATSMLHRLTNGIGNCLVATYLKLPFDLKRNTAANVILEGLKPKPVWRFPLKKTFRVKNPIGNDARCPPPPNTCTHAAPPCSPGSK